MTSRLAQKFALAASSLWERVRLILGVRSLFPKFASITAKTYRFWTEALAVQNLKLLIANIIEKWRLNVTVFPSKFVFVG